MASKKKVHLQQFCIIHLPNPDLTYIRNLERYKILFMPFHLLKTFIRNPSMFFISFFTLPPTGIRRWQPRSARAYIHVGRWVLPSFYFCQVGLPKCSRRNFLVLLKLYGCQVRLPNCWSCSYTSRERAFSHGWYPRRPSHTRRLQVWFFHAKYMCTRCGDSNRWPLASHVASLPFHLHNTSDWVEDAILL
jgi:hypothetical protein